MATQRITLPIYNLGCGGGGSLAVERALAKEPGVAQVYVNASTEMAYVVYDPTVASPTQFAAVIESLGHGPQPAPSRSRANNPQLDKSSQGDSQSSMYLAMMLTGLGLAAMYAMCVALSLLLPGRLQMYRLWAAVLPGVNWAVPPTLLLGLVEAFLYGALAAWTFGKLYRVLAGQLHQ
jgi:cation transport ATPase